MLMMLAFALVACSMLMIAAIPATISPDEMLHQLDTLSGDLTTALDPERRKAALDEILKPFQEGGPYFYVSRKEGIDPATKTFTQEENQQAAFKLFHLEDFTRKAEPAAQALEAREKLPPTAEECCRVRGRLVGLS